MMAWTLAASWLFATIGKVPLHSWWFYAVPWPGDFLWDGAYLTLSGGLASVPFILIGQFLYRRRQANGPQVYGQTGWADRKAMRAGGLHLRDRL
jgi:hypothetical protein